MQLFVRPLRLFACAAISALTLVNAMSADVAAQGSPMLMISEVHPSGSGNAAYGADWFEITNIGTEPVNITGWKVDDSSNAIATAAALRGVTLIPAGKSAVFFEGLADGSTDAAIKANLLECLVRHAGAAAWRADRRLRRRRPRPQHRRRRGQPVRRVRCARHRRQLRRRHHDPDVRQRRRHRERRRFRR